MSRLLINENPLQVLPTLAVKIGLNEAMILQQMHYWLNAYHNKNYILTSMILIIYKKMNQ